MATEGSSNYFLNRAVKHYSSLFRLPPYGWVLLLLALTCISVGLISSVMLLPPFKGFVHGLILGISLLFTNLTFDYTLSRSILKHDPIYNLRRIAALSLFCWVLWFPFIFTGVVIAMLFDLSWLIKLHLLGLSFVLIFRLIVLSATSSVNYKRVIVTSALHPLPCAAPFLILLPMVVNLTSVLFFLICTLAIASPLNLLFTFIVNRVSERTLGLCSIPLFKAFLLNWVADLNAPLEEFLEKLGEEQGVEVSLMKFDSLKPKAVIIAPSAHSGPFKNVGSSFLPFMLKNVIEQRFNCTACVLHGLLGHELDLTSQVQNRKIINHIIKSAGLTVYEDEATPFVKVSNGLATCNCQIFGKSAIIGFTLAPKTTEDLPQELGIFARQEAKKYGLTHSIVVNAHNSINGVVSYEEALNALKVVATACLEKATSFKPLPFRIGIATIMPKEYGLKDGMGLGGITVLVVEVGEQKAAYVVIDGNNMVSGLREEILSALRSLGISDGEVFTTDTHSVVAMTSGRRGYHPVGEVMDREKLISYVKGAAQAALTDLEYVKVAYCSITVPNVKVIGQRLLKMLCFLIDKALQEAKKAAVVVFAISFFLLTLLLTLI